jgi:hypothetical protein
MRLRATQKRDQRLVDTWKKEMEQPSVQEILQNYAKNRDTSQIQDMLKDESQTMDLLIDEQNP